MHNNGAATKSQAPRTFGSEETDFEGFYNIWAWIPSWPCELNIIINVSSKGGST